MSEKDELEQLKADNEHLRELSKFHYECSEFYCDERDKLKAENRRLSSELEHLQDGYGSMSREHSQTIVELSDAHFDIDGLKAENAKLRELLVSAFDDMNAWQRIIAGSNEWGYGRGCLDRLCKLRDEMRELGMEVKV